LVGDKNTLVFNGLYKWYHGCKTFQFFKSIQTYQEFILSSFKNLDCQSITPFPNEMKMNNITTVDTINFLFNIYLNIFLRNETIQQIVFLIIFILEVPNFFNSHIVVSPPFVKSETMRYIKKKKVNTTERVIIDQSKKPSISSIKLNNSLMNEFP